MKKKIMSLALAVSMLASAVPMVSAADLESTSANIKNKINSVAGLLSSKWKVEDGVVSEASPIKVDADMQVKKGSASSYAEEVTINVDGTVDYKAVLEMGKVADLFNQYIALAKKMLGATDEDIAVLPVTGKFDITITYPKNEAFVLLDTQIKENNKDLYGFGNVSENVMNGIFEETARVFDEDANTITITVEVTDDIYATQLAEENAFKDIEFYCGNDDTVEDGVQITKTGTYTVSVAMEGDVYIGGESIADTTTIAYANFVAVQKGDEEANIDAVVTVETSGGGSGMGGGSTTKKVTAKFMDGDTVHATKTYTLTNGSATVDFATIDVPETDENKIFAGWYEDKDCTQKADSKEEITKDTTYYAKWIDTKHNIGFVVDGEKAPVNTGETGSVVVGEEHISVEEDGVSINIDGVAVKDKKIVAWYLDPEHTQRVEGDVDLTGDIIFYGVTEEISIPPILVDGDATGEHYAYIIGYPEGDVRPTASITRAEVATIFFRLLTEESRNANMTSVNSFPDVNAGDWYNNAISTMAAMGIVNGYEDGTFKPDDAITRAEFAAIAARFADGEGDDVAVFADVENHWSKAYVAEAVALQWIAGYEDGTFRPENEITRAEVMTIVNRVLKRRVTSDNILEDAVYWSDNPESAWYYTDVMEATNSHKFERVAEGQLEEIWTQMLENRDWSELEK